MPSINIKHTTETQPLIIFAGTSSLYQSITIDAIVRSLRVGTIGALLPSPTPNLGIQPPIPKGLQPPGYTTPNFDHLTLSRLEVQPTETLLTNVEYTQLKVTKSDTNTIYDLSDRFINGDFTKPISGSSVGSIQIGELGLNDFNISDLNLSYGDQIEWSQCWGNVCLTIAKCYILATPVLSSEGGFLKYQIAIGDELALKADTSRVPVSKYCGASPTTAGQAARIYAETHNLLTKTFPSGHQLLDRQDQSFTNERPYDFLSALYAPTDHDVRTDETGIIVAKRPTFNSEKQVVLTKDLVIEVESVFSQYYKPTSKLKVTNNYTLLDDYKIVNTYDTTFSGLSSNTKPWFQGGYTFTTTEKATLGTTVVWSKITTYGYVPVGNSITEAQFNEDPCDFSTIDTVYDVISTKYTSLTYTLHRSGAYLINQSQEWFYTKDLEKIGTFYFIRDDLHTYKNTTYKHTAQINNEVCQKDYLHFLTYVRVEDYQLSDNFLNFTLIKDSITDYRVRGSSPLNASSFVGVNQSWIKTTVSGTYDKDLNTFILDPNVSEEVSTPPSGLWIRPSTKNIIAFTSVELNVDGSLETKPIQAPFCYTETQLKTFGKRTLRETYGLSQGLSLIIPFYLTVNIGDSILYENKQYIVYNIEVNQTLNQATKTIILSLWIG